MSEKKEKLIIIGKSGSGKDFLMRKLSEKGLSPGVKCTSRPMRKYEEQGVNYDYITEKKFISLIDSEKMFTHQKFVVTPDNSEELTWYYGITNEEFLSKQLFIMTPGELLKIPDDIRKGCFIVYLDIDRNTRESRLKVREDKNDSVTRRLDSDEIDFSIKIDYDLRITDPDFTADDVYDLME